MPLLLFRRFFLASPGFFFLRQERGLGALALRFPRGGGGGAGPGPKMAALRAPSFSFSPPSFASVAPAAAASLPDDGFSRSSVWDLDLGVVSFDLLKETGRPNVEERRPRDRVELVGEDGVLGAQEDPRPAALPGRLRQAQKAGLQEHHSFAPFCWPGDTLEGTCPRHGRTGVV